MSNPKAAFVVLAVLAFASSLAAAAPLAEPSLSPGQDIRQESGEVTVPGLGAVSVVRYTWRDSGGDPRSVSLVPASPSTSGYAVQMTYVVTDAAVKRTAYVNVDAAGDGGFGYFVSHELVRSFDTVADQPIASLHGEDDSPLGRYLPSTGTAQSAGATQAAHEYRLNYPHWGTVAAVPNPDPFSTTIPASLASHQKYDLPVVIRWHFVAGTDYPLWTADYDLSGASDHISVDVRGPYGVVHFNEGVGPDITALRWGDKYRFEADAGAAELGAKALAFTQGWTWNAANGGRRYHVLGSGSYEFGLVDIVPFSASKYADGFADRRGSTFAVLGGCGDAATGSLPCGYEWSYQSFQFNIDPPARPKFAWGSSPFLGSSLTNVFINGAESIPLSGKGRIRYGVHIVFGRQGTGTPLTLQRAAVPLEAAPTLAVGAAPGAGGSVSYRIHGDAGGPYTAASKLLAPWDSVSLTATPAGGYVFASWSGACAGVAGNTCLVTMNQSLSVTANFSLAGGGGLSAAPASLDFGGQSMNTTAPSQAVTITNTGGSPVTVSAVTVSTYFAVTHNCATLAPAASCTANVTFTPTAENSLNGTLTITSTAAGSPNTVALTGVGERSLVTHYYRSILRRAPDAGGKAFWESEKVRLPSLGANVNETWYAMATFFYFSPEYTAFNRDDAGFVTDLYNTFFNRPPDGGGLAFWTGQIASGVPREIVLVSFMFSNEFQTFTQGIFGNTAARKEIDTVVDFYRGLLSRLPDTGGFNFWVQQFRTAQCSGAAAVNLQVESISSGFMNSGEYAGRNRTNAQFVGDIYNALLRRGGDQGGVLFWIGQLNSGATRNSIRQQFIASPEFQGRVAAIIAQGCLP